MLLALPNEQHASGIAYRHLSGTTVQKFLFDRYIIERKDISHASSTWECVQTTDDTSVTVRKFNPTKDYLFRLRAENDFGVSDPSMSVSYYGKRGE